MLLLQLFLFLLVSPLFCVRSSASVSVSVAVDDSASSSSAGVTRFQPRIPMDALARQLPAELDDASLTGVNQQAMANVVAFLNSQPHHIARLQKFAVVDFTQHARFRRFFYFNFVAPAAGQRVTTKNFVNLRQYHVAHGSYSDPDRDGYATVFTNTPSSGTSSLGFYRVAETYRGTYGFSARLDGLSRANSKVRPRAIVMHPWDPETGNPTLGCFGLSEGTSERVAQEMSGGKGLIYAWYNQGPNDAGDAIIRK